MGIRQFGFITVVRQWLEVVSRCSLFTFSHFIYNDLIGFRVTTVKIRFRAVSSREAVELCFILSTQPLDLTLQICHAIFQTSWLRHFLLEFVPRFTHHGHLNHIRLPTLFVVKLMRFHLYF